MVQLIVVLRMVVTAGFLAAAIISGLASYFTLSMYEENEAVNHFNNVGRYAFTAFHAEYFEKLNNVMAISKNMALYKSNITEWPNVVIPGFYDVTPAQQASTNFGDVSFLPIVWPEKLASFEAFMRDYYASEPAINGSAGQLGVYSYDFSYSPYHDTTGEALFYHSPNKVLAPLFQCTFGKSHKVSDLALNMHQFEGSGSTIDYIMECSKANNYSVAIKQCSHIQGLVPLPLGAGPFENDFYTSIIQPIYLNHNSSQLVGFINGGFEWVSLLSRLFANNPAGIDIVIINHNTTATFRTTDGAVVFTGYGDLHDPKHTHLLRRVTPESTSYRIDYKIYLYPTDTYYDHFYTVIPIYAAVACGVLLGLIAITFFLYDFYMRKAAAAHAAVLETKRRFVRFISHEIRTPLNAIHLGLEVLNEELRRAIETNSVALLAPSLRSWLELSDEMTANSDSAEEVLNDLLNYDKIEIGALYLDFSSVPIWNIIDTGVVVSLEHFRQKNIRFSLVNRLFHVDNDLERQDNHRFVVVGDAARLAQVMRTLLSNALKFTPKNGCVSVHVDRVEGGIPHPNLVVPGRSVHLLQQPRAGSIRISVTDSGENLSEAQLAKICSEGVQFNANELQAGKGSGLGLFITKGIVEQHGGKLTVTSTGSGKGTTFAVELPLFHLPRVGNVDAPIAKTVEEETSSFLARANALFHTKDRQDSRKVFVDTVGDATSLASSAPIAGRPSRVDVEPETFKSEVCEEGGEESPPKYIMIVDDAPSNRKILNRIFTSKGYTCSQAEDGQQAIELYLARANKRPFCAISMDFEMPVMNGPTATALLRKLGCTVPIIGVTGNVLPDDIKYFLAQGATEVLGKPLNVNKFEEVMRQYENNNVVAGSSKKDTKKP